MYLDRAHTDLDSRRQHRELLSDANLGAHRSAGDNDAVSFDDECAIEWKPEHAGGAARLKAVELAYDLLAQFVEAEAGDRRHLDNRRAFERCAVCEQLDLVANIAQPRGVGEVRLGDHEDAAAGAEQMQDVEMLL